MYPFLEVASVKIQTYFLVMILIFTGTLFWVYQKSQRMKISRSFILDLTFILAVSGVFFARLFHMLFENPGFYISAPLEFFMFWHGGFVFLGGFLGALGVGIMFTILKKQQDKIMLLLDFYAPIIALDYALGRVGCFLAGCCYGKYCPYPWAIEGRHPTQLYAFAWDLILFLLLLSLEKRSARLRASPRNGYLFAVWLFGHGIGRFVLEFYRDDFRGPIFIFSLSGWISLGMIIAAIGLFWKLKLSFRSHRKMFKN